MTKSEAYRKFMYLQGQIQEVTLRAQYWHAMATTGAATKRDISRGRKLTEEEKAQGVSPWEPFTDQEKIEDALAIMKRHIDTHLQLRESLDNLVERFPFLLDSSSEKTHETEPRA